MKKLLTILLSCSSLLVSWATTIYTSTGDGNWSAASTFTQSGSGLPIFYVIQPGDTITVNVASTTPMEYIGIYGTLEFNNGRKVSMTATGLAQVYTGGAVIGGNGGSKFIFPTGTDVMGPFSVTFMSYATANTFGSFVAGALPVTWLNFSTTQVGNKVQIKWQTASEHNSHQFIVQSSEDGKTWTDLSTLPAAGNSNLTRSYSYELAAPDAGQHFYRIQQTDLDGSFKFSETRFVFIRPSTLSFDPNPVNHSLTVQAGGNNTLQGVEIFSLMGQKVPQAHSFMGNNIDISLLPNGIYLVHVFISNGEDHILRVIKD